MNRCEFDSETTLGITSHRPGAIQVASRRHLSSSPDSSTTMSGWLCFPKASSSVSVGVYQADENCRLCLS